MREVGVLEAKTHFSKLIAEAEAGEDIVITRNGRPVIRWVKAEPPRPVGTAAEQAKAIRDWISREIPNPPPFDLEAEIAAMRGRD